jgi:hypothetical protein
MQPPHTFFLIKNRRGSSPCDLVFFITKELSLLSEQRTQKRALMWIQRIEEFQGQCPLLLPPKQEK